MAAKKEQEITYFNIKGMRAANIRRLGKSGVIAFSLLGNGLGLYNLRIVKGKNGNEFIASPQEKGKDGKYYDVYAVYISDEDAAKIIKAVKEKAPDPEPEDAAAGDMTF